MTLLVTIPTTAVGNIVGDTGTQTLTNKTLTAPAITNPSTTGTDSGAETLTNKTLTSPVINGSPTGTGIPTLTIKTGSAGSNYTTTSTFLVAVDATNLKYVVTIPTGWKLAIAASGSGTTNTAVANNFIGLLDGASTIAQVQLTPSGAGVFIPFAVNWVITGDGNSHTIELAFATSNASDAAAILNGSSPPVMTFILTPSN